MDFLVAGLGNPGREYRNTRHNVGFMVVDEMLGAKPRRRKFQALFGERRIGGRTAVLIKPQAYMNRSGEAVRAWLKFLKLNPEKLIVVHDDLDFPLGKIRIKFGGGTGGHRGLESIVAVLKSRDFSRVRVGIGRPIRKGEEADYVLSRFSPEEKESLEGLLAAVPEAVSTILRAGVEQAQQRFN